MVRPVALHTLRTSVAAAALIASATSADAQRGVPTEDRGQPAATAIIRALDSFPIVAIGEVHRSQQLHDFLVHLLHDPRCLSTGGDLVVEFGNARYQDRVDRYVAGASIGEHALAQVWRDAVNILVWDAPVYERLISTVRDVNRTRPPARRLRVVLADPGIDWSLIHDRAAWERIAATRDRHAADVIEREVLARGRRAILVFGSGHVERESAFDRNDVSRRPRSPNLIELLEAEHPGAAFLVTADGMNPDLDARLARWSPPTLLSLRGTSLGEAHSGQAAQGPSLESLADAFLYLGPTASLTTSTPAPEIYADTTYLRELLRRDAIQGGMNAAELHRLAARFLKSESPIAPPRGDRDPGAAI
jgi:hypothetical protein